MEPAGNASRRLASRFLLTVIPGLLASGVAASVLYAIHVSRAPAVSEYLSEPTPQSDGLSAEERRDLTRQMLKARRENPEPPAEVARPLSGPDAAVGPMDGDTGGAGDEKLPDAKTAGVKVPDTGTPDATETEIKTPEIKTPAIRTPEIRTPEIKASDAKITDPRPADTRVTDVKVPEAKSPEAVRPAEVRPAEARPAEVRPADAKAGIAVRTAPDRATDHVATAPLPAPRPPAVRQRPDTAAVPPAPQPPAPAVVQPPVTANAVPPPPPPQEQNGFGAKVLSGLSSVAGSAANATGKTVNWMIDLPGKAIDAGGKLIGINRNADDQTGQPGSAPPPVTAPPPAKRNL